MRWLVCAPLALLFGCLACTNGGGDSSTEHPGAGAVLVALEGDEVVVSMTELAGSEPEATAELTLPVVEVYADGRVYAPDLEGRLHRLDLEPAQLGELVDSLLSSGIDDVPDRVVPEESQQDGGVGEVAATTIHYVTTRGQEDERVRVRSVSAPGLGTDPSAFPPALAFVERQLRALAADTAVLGATDDGVGVRLVAQGGFETTDPVDAGAVVWPPDLTVPVELSATSLSEGRLGVVDVTGSAGQRYSALVGRVLRSVVLPDGRLVAIAARPLLPSEI